MPSRGRNNYTRPTARVEVPIQVPEMSFDSLVRVTTQLKEAVERLREYTFGYVSAGGGEGSEGGGGSYLPLTGGTLTGPLAVAGQTLPISFTGPDASNVNVRWVNADGTERGSIYAAANNGAMVLRNRAGTGTTQSYLQLDPDGNLKLGGASAILGIKAGSIYVNSSYPQIDFYDTNIGGDYERLSFSAGNGWMRFFVADAAGASTRDLLTINPTSNQILANMPIRIGTTANIYFDNTTAANAQDLSKHLRLYGTDSAGYGLCITGSRFNYNATSGAAHAFYVGSDEVARFPGSGLVGFPLTPTTTNAGNTYMSSGGYIYRSTSARKYKEHIEDLSLTIDSGAVIDALQPVTFYPKGLPPERQAEYRQAIGIIADDAVPVVPQLGFFDEEGAIDGFQYERMSMILLAEMQQVRKRLAALEGK